MKKEEIINRNISLTFDFLRQIIKNPKIIDDISDGSTIDFIQKDVPIIENQNKKKADEYFKIKYQFEKI